MIVHYNDTEIDLPVNDDSYRYRAIKGEHSLTLHYSLPQHIEIPIGAYCSFQGEIYTLENPQNFKKNNTRNFEYTLIMDSSQAKLKKYKFKDKSRRLKFSLTALPQEHLQMLLDNLNDRESGWTVGECLTSVEKVISYNHASCIDALNQMADAFETEWEIDRKTIHLRRVEYNKDNPLPLSYGRGSGFKPGVGKTNIANSMPIDILYVQGGERNIDASKYGNTELLLPKNQELNYEGRTYVSDADGFSIQRTDKPLERQTEGSLDCSHIYPSRVGVISGVEKEEESDHKWDFFDKNIPNNLDYSQCRMDGEKITIAFQSGMLAGKEFDIVQEQYSVSGYVHSERRFKLASQTIDGVDMPNDIFKPVEGDKYAVFGISMPEAYVCDDATQSGASWDMFREAAKYLYENEDPKFTFTGELDGIWAKQRWLEIGGKIKLGGYVLFSDSQFQQEGILIRIVGVKETINNPYSPTIELSNTPVGSSIMSDLRKIESNEVVVENLHKDALQFTKRRYQDTQKTVQMLQESMLHFSGSINPITVATMQMLVGDESLQFRFVNSRTTPSPVPFNVTYDDDTKVLTAPAGILQHMTLGIGAISPQHQPDDYLFWDMEEYKSPSLSETDKGYYLYAKCNKATQKGLFLLSETPIDMDSAEGFYYLLTGLVNNEFEGARSYVSLYGFTEVLPGQVITDIIRSTDGETFFDLVQGVISGKITFQPGSSGLENVREFGGNFTTVDGGLILTSLIKMLTNGTQIRSYEGDWMLQADGHYQSPVIDRGQITRMRINFQTENPNMMLGMDLKVSCEEKFDWEIIGYPDDENPSLENCYKSLTGFITERITVPIPEAGNHFILICFKKGFHDMVGENCAWFKVIPTESGGLSANLDNILLYGGGTYAQALQNTANIILRHDGSGQLAGGNITWNTNGDVQVKGEIQATGGVFNGYLQTPFRDLGYITGVTYLSFDTGFNCKVIGDGSSTLVLPTATEYNGMSSIIYVPNPNTRVDWSVIIRIQGGGIFYYPTFNLFSDPPIKGVLLWGRKLLISAIKEHSDSVVWYIDNYKEFVESDFTHT